MTEPTVRTQHVLAVARALVAMDGSATLPQVYAWIEDNGLRRVLHTPEGMTEEEHYRREVRFARQELLYGGLLVTVGNRWRAVDMDLMLALTPDAVQQMIRQNNRDRRDKRTAPPSSGPIRAGQMASRQPTASTGPRPVSWSREVTRADGPAQTYALRFGDTDLWKIGFASDARSRVSVINRHLPTELVDITWVLVRSFRWPNQLAAYAMEQEVLTILASERTIFERVRCSPERLASAWDQARAAIVRQQPARGRAHPQQPPSAPESPPRLHGGPPLRRRQYAQRQPW